MPGLDCSKRALCYNPPPRPLPGAAPLSQPEPNMSLRVDSEIGRLRRVLVHRPGREIDWMVPAMMETLLFDDILDGDEARDEHDLFSEVLRQAGAEVLEAQDLLAGVLKEGSEPRRRLLDELEAEYGVSFSLVRRLDELPPAWPPIWAIPASKLTRVRVEDFSKIIPSVLRCMWFSYFDRFALTSAARRNRPATSAAVRSWIEIR
ncbi:MAG: hypothetical protein DMF53_13655 [Acidobacteria bacterium]|nr:MAG: hypothetical protein DMF53_13655 [Acidobacteriota bacterium]